MRRPHRRRSRAGKIAGIAVAGLLLVSSVTCQRKIDSRPNNDRISANVQAIPRILERFDAIPVFGDDAPWKIFHRLHATGSDFILACREGSTEPFSDWLHRGLEGQPVYHGMPLIQRGPGRPHLLGKAGSRNLGPSEAHLGQFLWILDRAGVDFRSTPILIDSPQPFTLYDCYLSAIESTTQFTDVSWLVPLVAAVDDGSAEWTTRFGKQMSFGSLVDQLLSSPAGTGPCLGMHRFIGLADTARIAGERGLPLPPEVRTSIRAQLDDLSKGKVVPSIPGNLDPAQMEIVEVVAYGHALEGLMYLPDEYHAFDEPWAHDFVAHLIVECERMGVPASDEGFGALAHATRALRMYRDRFAR